MCNYKYLIRSITNCPNIKAIYKGEDNCCSKIVRLQKDNGVNFEAFKGPEPWNGKLNKAKILIISSNPGIADNELIPTRDWCRKKKIDFYQNRFSSKENWVNELRAKLINGFYSNKISNWTQTKKRMDYLFGNGTKIGEDYALLELVHCKSKKEYGVQSSIEECTKRFFDKIIKITPAKVLIIIGDHAINYICNRYHIDEDFNGYGLYQTALSIEKIYRLLIFLPHTNYYGRRKAEYFVNANETQRIRNFLTSDLKNVKL